MLECILDHYQPDAHQQQQQHNQQEQQQSLESYSGPHTFTELQRFCAPFFLLLNLCVVYSSPEVDNSALWCSSQRAAADVVVSGSPAAVAAAVAKEAAPYSRWQQLVMQLIRAHSRYLQVVAAADGTAAAGKGATAAGGEGAEAAAAAGEGAAAAAGEGAAAAGKGAAAGGDAIQELELSLQYKGAVVAFSQKPVGILVCEMGARLGLLSAVISLLENGVKQFFYEPDVSWWVLGQLEAMVKVRVRVHNVGVRRQLEQQQQGKGGEGEQQLRGPLSNITGASSSSSSSRSGERSSSSSSGRGNGGCSSREVTSSGSDTNSSSKPSCSSSSGASSREGSAAAAGGGGGGGTSSYEKVSGHGWDPTSAVLLEFPFTQQRIQQYTQGSCSSKVLAAMEQIAGSGRTLAECRGELEAKVLRDVKEYGQMVARSCVLGNVLIERAVAVAEERAEGGGSRRAVVINSNNSNSPADALFSVAGMVLYLNAAVITYVQQVEAKQEEGQQQQQQHQQQKKKNRNKKKEQGSQQQNLLRPQKEEQGQGQQQQQQQQGVADDELQSAGLVARVGHSCHACLNGLMHLVRHSPGSEVKTFGSQNASVLVPLLLQLMHAAPSRDVRYLVWGLMDPRELNRQLGGKGFCCF